MVLISRDWLLLCDLRKARDFRERWDPKKKNLPELGADFSFTTQLQKYVEFDDRKAQNKNMRI